MWRSADISLIKIEHIMQSHRIKSYRITIFFAASNWEHFSEANELNIFASKTISDTEFWIRFYQ